MILGEKKEEGLVDGLPALTASKYWNWNWKECRRCIKLFIVQHSNFHFGTECVYILQYTQYTWLIFSPLLGAALCACASSSTHGHAALASPDPPGLYSTLYNSDIQQPRPPQ